MRAMCSPTRVYRFKSALAVHMWILGTKLLGDKVTEIGEETARSAERYQ